MRLPDDAPDQDGNAASLGVEWWPVSCMQARLWMLHRLDESSTAYHMARGQWIDGPLDVPALERSLRLIVERHEVLRAKFIEEDGLLQQVIRPARQVAQLDVISCKEADCDGLAREFVDRPFDLSRDPLIRVQLLHLHSRRHMLLVCIHHIVADGWSVRIVAEELQRAYNAYRANTEHLLPKLSVRYRDFVVEQDGEVVRARHTKLLSYWREALQGAPPLLELPLDHPRPAQRSGHGAQRHFTIEQSLRAELEAQAMRRGVSLHMLLLAAFTLLLSRYSNQRDILVGTPVANRDPRWAPLVGMFVNTVPIRVQVDRDTSFAQYLTQVKRACLAAYARQDLPFELLVEELQPTRTLSHVPLIQNVFMVNDASGDVLSLDGLQISAADLPVRDAKFDLLLSLELQRDGIVGRLEFQTDIYEAPSIARFGTHYCNLLRHVVYEPDCNVLALPIVGAEELEQDYRRWNATEQPFDTSLRLHELFVRQARRTPSATALIFNDRHMSYAELLRRSAELAVRLRAAGAGRNELVAVVCDKGFEQVIAVMGVLLAGAAYMPIESDWPAERQTHLLAIGLVKHVVCQHHIRARTFMPADLQYHVVGAEVDLEDVEVGEDIRFVQQPDDLAYVIFTSGSTGTPKGVVIQHRAAVNTIVDMNARYAVGPKDRVLALSLLSFDLSVYDIFGVLGAGGALVIPGQEHGKDPAQWWALVQRHGVSLWNSVPALMQMMVDYLESERVAFNAQLRWCFMSGDWIPLDLPKRIQALGPKIDVHSGGGATEASIWSITYPIREIDPHWRSIPYGKPLANQSFFVLNERLVPCPIGVTGDLYIGGVGLAHSYWRDEAKTAERFITVPQSGQRLYKTGDLGRYLPDGDIEFMGRADRQVKVNGYRIELAEIEAALARCEGVKDAVACVRDDAGTGRSIAAYVTTRGPQPLDVLDLRQSMQRLLPGYMVPSSFVVLDELPLTANGKVDGKRLPRPDLRDSDDTPFVLARDRVEASLCGAFRELLNVDEVGIHQDFFKLGGHSLSAARLTHRIRNALHVDLPVREVFVHTTVEALARRVRELARSDDGRPSLHPYADVGQVEPVSYAQYGLWIQSQFDPAAKAYNMPAAIRLSGSLDIERLERAFEQILQRHESLRTRFVERGGELLQEIVEQPRFEIRRLQWHDTPSAELEQKITELAYRDASEPFDLEVPPLIRATLVTLAAEAHLLLFGIHHIVCDGWSYGVLLKELTTLYVQDRGAGSLPQLPVQYRHFSRWQRDWLAAGELERHFDYWERKLSGRRDLRLPCASAPPGRAVAEGQTRRFHASEEITRELSAASSRAGTTRFVMLMAAFKVLMSWYDRHTDICVGTTVAGRPLPQLESMIGLFANQVVIRTDLSGDPSVRELAIRVHHEVMAAMEHQAMPYALLAERLCSSDATPLFRVKFVYETLNEDRLQLPGLVATPLDVDNGSVKFDLLMIMGAQGETLRGSLQYRRGMFAESFIGNMLELWHELLTHFAVSDRARLSDLYTSLDQRAAQLDKQQGERGAHEVRSRS
jgi:amino acid adenylation domain-containing protein